MVSIALTLSHFLPWRKRDAVHAAESPTAARHQSLAKF